jgi:hypothetical protein
VSAALVVPTTPVLLGVPIGATVRIVVVVFTRETSQTPPTTSRIPTNTTADGDSPRRKTASSAAWSGCDAFTGSQRLAPSRSMAVY